ncbi:unnamed protein product [Phytomonas sp. Hart1]|nr:unnamed protein product [Phytomonas sp. Hart1]|eukprot:CCW68749.1 unnamed protein product [Phytomonas sp. isolate Hart1]
MAKPSEENHQGWSSDIWSASLITHYLMERVRSVESTIKFIIVRPCIQLTLRRIRQQTSEWGSKLTKKACTTDKKGNKTNDEAPTLSE